MVGDLSSVLTSLPLIWDPCHPWFQCQSRRTKNIFSETSKKLTWWGLGLLLLLKSCNTTVSTYINKMPAFYYTMRLYQAGCLFYLLLPKKWTSWAKKWCFIQSGAVIKTDVLFTRIKHAPYNFYTYLRVGSHHRSN